MEENGGYINSNYNYTSLSDYESRIELLKLKNFTTSAERSEALKRFLDMAICCRILFSDITFSGVFKTYAANEEEYLHLFETELKETSPETFEQYLVYKYVENTLIERGFKKELIDKAIGKAFSEGIDFDKTKLLERCLQILGDRANASLLEKKIFR